MTHSLVGVTSIETTDETSLSASRRSIVLRPKRPEPPRTRMFISSSLFSLRFMNMIISFSGIWLNAQRQYCGRLLYLFTFHLVLLYQEWSECIWRRSRCHFRM